VIDALFVLVIVAMFWLTWLFAKGCNRLLGPWSPTDTPTEVSEQ
jgi:hypothetical protein